MIRLPLLACLLPALAIAQTEHPIETDATREPSFQVGKACVIDNVTIHTATRPAFDGSVYVMGGKIVGVGGYDGPMPADANRIDGRGYHLVPGVVDNHSHTAIERGINEGTLSITAEVRIADEVDPDDINLYRALAGGVTTIRQLHGSANTIGGQDEVLKLRWGTLRRASDLVFPNAPQGIKFALGENVKQSNGFRRSERFPATRMGVEAVLQRAFTRTREYQAEWKAYHAAVARGEDPAPPRKDLRLETLSGVLDGSILVHSHCYRSDEILMLIRTAQQFGIQIATLQHVLEGYKVAWEMAQAGVGGSTFSDWWSYKVEAYDAIPQNADMMMRAGVLTSINSDSDEMMRRLYQEASKSLRYANMDPVRALAMVTLYSAQQLGIGDRVGSIEVGKDADLVLLNADPMSGFARVEWTMVDGQIEFARVDAFGLDTNPAQPTPRTLDMPPARELHAGPAVRFTGGTVHTMAGEPIENCDLVVQDGRIAAVGTQIDLAPGLDTTQWTTIDARGKHLWPGMIAMNSSLGLYEIGSVRATLDADEIGDNQADLRVTPAIHADSAHIPVARWTGITRAQVVPGGRGPALGQSAVIDLAGDTWEELLTLDRDMLHLRMPNVPNREIKEGGGPGGPGGPFGRRGNRDRDPEKAWKDLADLLEEARHYGRRVHAAEDGTAAAPPFDPRLAALVPFALGERPVAMHAGNAATILRALKFAKESEVKGVLYGAEEAWKVIPAIAESGVPVVFGPLWSLPGSEFDPYDSIYSTPALLARAGIPFAILNGDPENERNLPFHAGSAVTFGLPAEEAARAVTLYPAQILGLEDQLGALLPGLRADIVVTDGHLLDTAAHVEHVFIDGTRVPHDDNRHTRLARRYEERLQRLLER
ncbi:MAG: amidohydrolase family protein [Planctomycetota bacterium]